MFKANLNRYVLKIVIPNGELFCVYLFDPVSKVLLSFNTGRWSVESMMLAKEGRAADRPHVHTVLLNCIKILDGEVLGAFIYGFSDDILFTKLKILKNSEICEVEAKVSDAISVALWAKKPIFVAQSVVDGIGVRVTRELLERSLCL